MEKVEECFGFDVYQLFVSCSAAFAALDAFLCFPEIGLYVFFVFDAVFHHVQSRVASPFWRGSYSSMANDLAGSFASPTPTDD
jgi:hypothetical protein